MKEALSRTGWSEPDAFWFDYVADIGDGQLANYNLAYLLLGDAKVPGLAAPLPRGSFLLTGGDTAYHVADVETLHARVAGPVLGANVPNLETTRTRLRHAHQPTTPAAWRVARNVSMTHT